MENKEEKKEQKPKRVEELKHFPFKNFDELKKRLDEGIANLVVDRGIALQWILRGIYSTGWQRAYALFLCWLTYIIPIGLIIYIIVTKTWLLLLALPLLLIGFLIFHPGQAMLLGAIRSGLILLTFVGLVWGFINGISWLTALTLSLAILWYAQRTAYRKAVDGLARAAIQHEDLFCILWSTNALIVRIHNGNSYSSKWKTEGGKTTHYDTGITYDE